MCAVGAGCCRALGVGCAAGAAAGFAVVPVAAQVDFDGQSTVGSCLVLAAVVWGREGKRYRYGKGKENKPIKLMSSFFPPYTACPKHHGLCNKLPQLQLPPP